MKRQPKSSKSKFDKSKGFKESLGKYIEKPRHSLIPKEALDEMAIAFGFGELKYSAHNFKKGIKVSYLLDAASRHMLQFNCGENFDKQSKAHHLGSAMTNLAMAIWMVFNKQELDDRYAHRKRPKRSISSTRPK